VIVRVGNDRQRVTWLHVMAQDGRLRVSVRGNNSRWFRHEAQSRLGATLHPRGELVLLDNLFNRQRVAELAQRCFRVTPEVDEGRHAAVPASEEGRAEAAGEAGGAVQAGARAAVQHVRDGL